MKTLPSDAVPITLALFLFSKLSKKLKLDIKKKGLVFPKPSR